MLVRRAVAVLGALSMLTGLALVSGSPVGAVPAPPAAKSIVVSVTPAAPVATTTTKLAVSITPRGGGQPKGGTVTFLDGDVPIATATATTRMTTASVRLSAGSHTITAAYDGDSVTAAGVSGPLEVFVGPASATTKVTVSPNPVEVGSVAEIKARVRPAAPAHPSGKPTGTVEFAVGRITATVRINSNGVATWRKVLPVGEHIITATYSGDATYAGAEPGTATVTVVEPASRPAPPTIAASSYNTCAIDGGAVRCWGYGWLGNGTIESSATPATVTDLTNAVAVAGGSGYSSCALLDDGTARCWGSNDEGQLGDGSTTSSVTPVAVAGLTGAVSIAGGRQHACALLDDGTVRCWGSNSDGQLGDGSTTSSMTPVTVTGVTGAVAISAGGSLTCVVLDDGTARCWGNNDSGQLGDGTTTDSSLPVTVALTDIETIDVGFNHTCAVLGDGTARCWGLNYSGELGNGTVTDSTTPVTVTGLADVAAISGGYGFTCAVLDDGTARCWGSNRIGQLGDGSVVDALTPVVVSGLIDATEVTLGENHTCAALSDGGARCWGYGYNGQMGNGVMESSPTPVAVVGLPASP